MEPLKYKRPGTQKPSQTTKITFGSPRPVPKALRARPQNSLDGMRGRLGSPASALTHAKSAKANSVGATLPALAVAAVVSATPTTPQAAHLARRVPMDMDLPGKESPLRLRARYRRQRRRQQAFRGLALAMVVVITMGGLLFSQSYFKLHKVFKGTETAAALKPNVNPDLLKGEGSGRVNILLLGRGGGTHDAPDLTDTMMLASIDPVNRTATLVSLPRDLWVNVPSQGVMKLNAAWETGEFKYQGKTAAGSTDPKAAQAGFAMVDQTVEDVLGVDVNYNVLVDFKAFQQAVDTVGGVTINVPVDLVDPTMAWENHNNPVLAKAGVQNFDGTGALRYVRSRETSSDFARAERQRALLVALKAKVASMSTLSNPVKVSKLLGSFGDNVQTDLSVKNAQRLYSIVKKINDSRVMSVGLGDSTGQYVTTGNINGQSVVLPKAGLFKYAAIQQFIRTQLKDPFIAKEKAKVVVLNGSPVSGAAAAKAAELESYGYNVIGSGNTPSSDWTQTRLVDLSHGKKKYTKHYLEQRLGVSAVNSLPSDNIQANGADFVIIIGSDEATPAQP